MEVKTPCSQCPSSIKPYVDKIAEKQGYTDYKIDVKHVSTGGASYLATLYEVDIKGNTHDGEKETNIFIKNIFHTDQMKDWFFLSEAYLNESYFYNELSKTFIQLQDEASVPVGERFNSIKDYGVSDSEAIVLENAVKQGYTTYDRMKTTSLKLAELSIEQLARFHGLSFVIKKKMPEYFEKYIANTKFPFEFNDGWAEGGMVLCNHGIRNIDRDLKKKLEERLPNLLANHGKYMRDTESSISCLCHGDYRTNNILIKEVGGDIVKVIPHDYQLINYGSPIHDFIFYIYLGTDKEFRTKHLEYLKELYHGTMKKFLKYFDIDKEEVCPRKEFENSLESKRDMVLILSLYFYPLFFCDAETVPDLQNDIRDSNIVMSPPIEKRLFEIIDEFFE